MMKTVAPIKIVQNQKAEYLLLIKMSTRKIAGITSSQSLSHLLLQKTLLPSNCFVSIIGCHLIWQVTTTHLCRPGNRIPVCLYRCQIYNLKFIVSPIAELSSFRPEQLLIHFLQIIVSTSARLV